MELNATKRSIEEVFSPSKKYSIPRFQREYSWKNEELDEFWDDIVDQIKVVDGKLINQEYFIGCIVLVGEDTKFDYLIVDGQQRLTTLTIFLKCIVTRLLELNDTDAANALYENVIEGKDNDGRKYFKLVNESPKPYFQNELQNLKPKGVNKAETNEEKLLEAAANRLQKKISSFRLEGQNELDVVKAIREQVLKYLKIILITAKNEDDASTIFETLNARGVNLTSVDLIKNWIFKNYNEEHPNDNAKDIWNTVRAELAKFSDLETFFRHYWNSKYSFASNDRLYKSFKNQLKKAGRIKPAKEFLLEIRDAAHVYKKIGLPVEKDWPIQKQKVIFYSLESLNLYKVTQVRPFLLALLETRDRKNDNGKNLIDESTMIEIVSNLEKFHFVFSNLCQERASGLENIYTGSAKNIHAAEGDRTEIKKVIVDLYKSLQQKMPNAEKMNLALKKLKFTTNDENDKKTIQIIFKKIEQNLLETKELNVGNFSIEHIQDQATRANWVGEIGNLIPLDERINNNLGAGLTFSEKKRMYENSNLKIVTEFLRLNAQDHWDEKASQAWSNKLGELLVKATALTPIA